MNGKDYVVKARETAEKLLAEIKAQGCLSGEPLLAKADKACADLERLQNKTVLRTRNGANLAFPVLDAAEKLQEAWAEVVSEAGVAELIEGLDEFVRTVEVLEAALKERTVIMT
ncbi:MAG: hypothetical protein AB1641_10330 [Thermodesulfobacteriota bacterium]